MKILGIGVDIIENRRITKSIRNKKFLRRVYNNLEINTLHFIEWPEIIPCKIIKSNIDIYLDVINGQRLISIDIVI